MEVKLVTGYVEIKADCAVNRFSYQLVMRVV